MYVGVPSPYMTQRFSPRCSVLGGGDDDGSPALLRNGWTTAATDEELARTPSNDDDTSVNDTSATTMESEIHERILFSSVFWMDGRKDEKEEEGSPLEILGKVQKQFVGFSWSGPASHVIRLLRTGRWH